MKSSVEINLLTGTVVREYDYRSSYPKENVNMNAADILKPCPDHQGPSCGNCDGEGFTLRARTSAGPKHVPGRSLKETATAIRKELIRQTGPLAGVAVEVRRQGGRQLLCTFTHHTGRKVLVTREWMESEAGKAAHAALEALLADYRDGAPEPKGPEDPQPFGWTIAEAG